MVNKQLLQDFSSPTQLPASTEEHASWQEANRRWWEDHPMRYDWKASLGLPEFSRTFYAEADRRLFEAAEAFLPSTSVPFDGLIDFRALATQDVLEIGVGLGCHAGLIAPRARSFVGIDLTIYATRATSRRLGAFDMRGAVMQMDAELMAFRDASFDFIWSWGVIHHSSDTARVLKEMARVLKPGGRATVMVYHRSPWSYYALSGVLGGLLRGHLLRTWSIHRSVQLQTDGALARYYSAREWRSLTRPYFVIETIRICGLKTEMIPLPAGRLKDVLMRAMPDTMSRFIGSTCRLGGFLVASMVKA